MNSKKNTLLVVNGDYSYCIRAKRLAHTYHNEGCKLSVLSHDMSMQESNIAHNYNFKNQDTTLTKARRFIKLLLRMHTSYLNEQKAHQIANKNFDTIICFDLICLPFITAHLTYTKLVVDLREYYPKQFEHNFIWSVSFAPLYKFICKKYLAKAEEHWTVSTVLQKAYEKFYKIKCELKPSIPQVKALPLKPIGKTVKLVHHGVANPNRNIEDMIEVVKLLPDNYLLDLYLVNNNHRYYRKIKALVDSCDRVKLNPPIPQQSIIDVLSTYDIGLFICKPNTFNLAHAWPNKVFEYHAAGLRTVTTPLPGMIELKSWQNNIYYSKDYSSESIACAINSLR